MADRLLQYEAWHYKQTPMMEHAKANSSFVPSGEIEKVLAVYD